MKIDDEYLGTKVQWIPSLSRTCGVWRSASVSSYALVECGGAATAGVVGSALAGDVLRSAWRRRAVARWRGAETATEGFLQQSADFVAVGLCVKRKCLTRKTQNATWVLAVHKICVKSTCLNQDRRRLIKPFFLNYGYFNIFILLLLSLADIFNAYLCFTLLS